MGGKDAHATGMTAALTGIEKSIQEGRHLQQRALRGPDGVSNATVADPWLNTCLCGDVDALITQEAMMRQKCLG